MKFIRVPNLLFILLASISLVYPQGGDKWRNYIDSSNEIWFQAPEQVLVRRDDQAERRDMYSFFDGVSLTISKRKVRQEPSKYVRGLELPFGEKGATIRDFNVGTFLVRQEIDPLHGADINISIYAGSKKSFFEIHIQGSKDRPWLTQFLQTVRFGNSRIDPNSTHQDLSANGSPIVFDQLAVSPEVEAVLNKKPVDSKSEIKFEKISWYSPLNLGQLSRNLIILERPIAHYSDSARMYNAQGTIPAKVEFLESGNIGKIVVDHRLDSSLARNVIDAVKKIKFIPAQANGKPVTVVRTLLYKFKIY